MFTSRGFRIEKHRNVYSRRSIANGVSKTLAAGAAAAGKGAYSSEFETPFPSDYDELIKQVSVTFNETRIVDWFHIFKHEVEQKIIMNINQGLRDRPTLFFFLNMDSIQTCEFILSRHIYIIQNVINS